MEKLDFEQMEMVEGGDMATAICGAGMLGWGVVMGYGAALAGVTAGVSAGIALIWGAISLGVCEAVGYEQ